MINFSAKHQFFIPTVINYLVPYNCSFYSEEEAFNPKRNPLNTLLQTAIETLLQPQKLPNGILRVKHGAQFSRFGSVAGWFVTMVLLIIAIVFNVQGILFASFPIYIACVLILAFVLDYQGIELNVALGKIRTYRSFLGYRYGKWYSLEQFTQIKILEDNIFEERALGSEAGSSRAYDNHKYYGAYLLNNDRNCFIKLFENESITKSRLFAGKFAEISGLMYDDRPGRGETTFIRF